MPNKGRWFSRDNWKSAFNKTALLVSVLWKLGWHFLWSLFWGGLTWSDFCICFLFLSPSVNTKPPVLALFSQWGQQHLPSSFVQWSNPLISNMKWASWIKSFTPNSDTYCVNPKKNHWCRMSVNPIWADNSLRWFARLQTVLTRKTMTSVHLSQTYNQLMLFWHGRVNTEITLSGAEVDASCYYSTTTSWRGSLGEQLGQQSLQLWWTRMWFSPSLLQKVSGQVSIQMFDENAIECTFSSTVVTIAMQS